MFSGQVSSIIKNLSDTILAAVGVLLGSFIASLFQNKFNPVVFRIGLVFYAIYIAIFPLTYSMLNQWQQYQNQRTVTSYERRIERFKSSLFGYKVEEISGSQVKESKKRFKQWFGLTLFTYAIVILIAVIISIYVPAIISNSIPTSGGSILIER